jgi:transposase
MRVVVHSAAAQDRDGAGLVLDKIRRRVPWLELIWADGGDNARQLAAAVANVPVLRIEIVKRSDDMSGFVVLPGRWMVERTFSRFSEIAASPRTSRTLPAPWRPSLPSPPSSSPSGGSPGRRLLSQALTPPQKTMSNMALYSARPSSPGGSSASSVR